VNFNQVAEREERERETEKIRGRGLIDSFIQAYFWNGITDYLIARLLK